MSAPPPESVIARIQKLLALSRDKSTTPHEAALAAERAQALLVQHQLEEHELPVDAQEKVEESDWIAPDDKSVPGGRRWSDWKMRLLAACAAGFGCASISGFNPLRREASPYFVKLVGRKTDCQTAIYVFRFLTGEIERLCDAWWEHRRATLFAGLHLRPAMPKEQKRSFREGAVSAIGNRLLEAQRRAAGGTAENAAPSQTSIVLASRAVALHDFMNGRVKHSRTLGEPDKTHFAASDAGFRAAEQIRLPGQDGGKLGKGTPQLEGGKP